MESGDELSLETTVPTDLSGSLDDDLTSPTDKKLGRHLYERKQLLHDIQVLKIELSQKSLMLDNLKVEHMKTVEELDEKLNDTIHEKRQLQARLESQLKIQQDDARRRTERIQKELDTILKRQQQLEKTNEILQERAADIRRDLKDLELTENQYHELKLKDEDELAIKDFVGIKLYETVRPWKIENSGLKTRCKTLNDELHNCKRALEKCHDELESLTCQHKDLESKYQRLSMTYAECKAQVQHGHYKIENFDKIKKERDEFETELIDLRKKYAYLEVTHETVTKERDDLSAEVASLKQKVSLLEKDKDFFSKQVSDLQNKLLYNEDKVRELGEQLERTKAAREELYEKYVASRDQYKMEYEAKLREELDMIRVRTNAEIDRLKTSTKEMYERENRGLREARDMALAERDRAQAAERDANAKCDQILQEYRQLQLSTDSKISELQNDLKLKAFEAERTQMVYEETLRNLKQCQLENEKQQKKLEVLTKEYYSLQMCSEKRIAELETELSDKKHKLESYERLEKELDEVVMQAAEVDEETEAERVLFSYGYGANVPTTTKRRLKQSVHLARRVLQLEKENTNLRKELEREIERNKELTEQVKSINAILDQSQQPYHYLVDGIRARDAQINKQRQHIIKLEEDIRRLEKQRMELSKSKNQLAVDLERLLNQKEEMSVMKQVVLSMSQRQGFQPKATKTMMPKSPKSPRSPRSPKSLGQYSPKSKQQKSVLHHHFEPAERDENIHKPAPTEFTVHDPPDWYSKLKYK